MKKLLSLATMCVCISQLAFAQLPDGSTAPNWTMNDISGTSHTLYNYLDNNKIVFLDFSATWCGPCWNYHNTHAFRDVYNQYGPPGSNQVMAFMIEGDNDTNTACLYGPSGCVGGTQGNWVNGTPYPIIDNHTQNSAYQIGYFPTIYGVCPDKKIYEVGQVGAGSLWNFAKGCSAPTLSLNSVTHIDCYGNTNGAINVDESGGMPPFTYLWSNGATTQDISSLPAGSYTLTVTGSLGGTKTIGPINVNQPSGPLAVIGVNITPEGCGQGGVIELSVSGGTQSYNYQWSSGGGNSPVNSGLMAGTYGVSITDANGCTTSQTNMVVAPPTYPVAVAASPTGLTCTTQSVTLSGAGSSTGNEFTYLWTTDDGYIVSGAGTQNNCVVNEAGEYQLMVFNSINNCATFASTVVTANQTEPMATAGPPGTLTCVSNQVTLNGVGPSGQGYNILWTTQGGNIVSGATTLTPVVNGAGSYTLSITNTSNGCTGTSTTSVTSNTTPPNVTANGGQITCTNANVNLSGNSTTPGASFAWTGPNGFTSSQQNPSVSAQGTYLLTVTNPTSGCTSTDDAEVVQNTTAPQASAQGGTLNCIVTSLNLGGSSTTPGASFAWTGPNGFTSSQQNPSVNAAGNYLLTVTGTNGCTQTATGVVAQNTTPPTANAGPAGVLNCNAEEVVLNGSNSSSGSQFVYNWTTTDGNIVSGATTLTPTVDEAGSYTLTVTNNINGCTSTAATPVEERQPVVADITAQVNILCNGNSTGSATAAGSGGYGAFSYAWSNGANTATVSNLAAGTYTVIVTDGEGCDESESVVITEPSELSVNATTAAQSAPGVNDGSATANPQGGAGNYTYQWSNGETTQTINGLAPGNYSVVVTDENGCEATQTVTVNVFGCAVSANIVGEDVSCNGSTDGTASITLTNAAMPQSFVWSNGEETQTIADLAPGSYTVSATDGNGCEVVASVEIDEPGILSANATTTGLTATGSEDGTATANPTGGTGPFTYAWSNGGTTQTINGLPSANYTVSVTDANGCVAVQTVPVAPFGCIAVASVNFSNISCFGENDGQATVTIVGGLTPFTYEWSNGETTATVSGLEAGIYTVSISDAVNCPAVAEVTISEPSVLEIVLEQATNTDCGVENGSATVAPSGGTPGFAYDVVWSNGQTGYAVTDLAAGTYNVSVTDLNNCHAVLQVEININDSEAPTVVTQNLVVAVNASGMANVTASQINNGSTDNCTIASMTLDQGSFTCDNLGTHEVTLTVVDEAGNTSTGTATVEVVDNSVPVISVQNITVSLDANGNATITADLLDNNSADNCGIVERTIDIANFDCSDIGQNAVVLTVKDASGNSAAGTAIVTVEDKVAPSITCPSNMVLGYCNPVATFAIQASDNCAPSLMPNQTSGLPSGATFPTGTTVQTFVVNDGNGNTNTCSFNIQVPVAMEVELDANPVTCFGEADGEIAATVTGGGQNYTYLWSNGATTATIGNLGVGQYTVSVTDNAGCQSVQSASISEPTAIISTPVQIVPETTGQQNGAIDVDVQGGVQPYNFEWKDANGNVIGNTEDITGIAAGSYSLEVTDANGCISLHVFTVQSVSSITQRQLEKYINIFPNPTTGFVTIAFDEIDALEANISLFDMTGKMVANHFNANVANGSFQMDVTTHAAGMYLVKIMIDNQVVTKRLVVQK